IGFSSPKSGWTSRARSATWLGFTRTSCVPSAEFVPVVQVGTGRKAFWYTVRWQLLNVAMMTMYTLVGMPVWATTALAVWLTIGIYYNNRRTVWVRPGGR